MTTFGTANTPHGIQVMLLGSGELGKQALIGLQRQGVETIAVDRYDNPPGQRVAYHAHAAGAGSRCCCEGCARRAPRWTMDREGTRRLVAETLDLPSPSDFAIRWPNCVRHLTEVWDTPASSSQ